MREVGEREGQGQEEMDGLIERSGGMSLKYG